MERRVFESGKLEVEIEQSALDLNPQISIRTEDGRGISLESSSLPKLVEVLTLVSENLSRRRKDQILEAINGCLV